MYGKIQRFVNTFSEIVSVSPFLMNGSCARPTILQLCYFMQIMPDFVSLVLEVESLQYSKTVTDDSSSLNIQCGQRCEQMGVGGECRAE
jgi:hypothetical protein